MYLGIPSVIKDPDKDRRSLYGKAGCFRLTRYGVEYRVLSSAMMKDSETLNFIWNQLNKAFRALEVGQRLIDSDYVIDAINNSNIELAEKLISTYHILD